MPFQVGPLEVIVLLIIVLIIFGPKRLPEMGRSLGRGIREFKSSISKEEIGLSTDKIEAATIERPAGDAPAKPLEGEVVQDRKA